MADEEKMQALKAVPLFQGFSDKDLARVAENDQEVHHEDGEFVMEVIGRRSDFHLILTGEADASTGGEVVNTMGPGTSSAMSLIDGQPRSATVTASEPLTTLDIPAWNFNRLLDEHPEMMRALLVELSARIRNLRDRHPSRG